MKQIEIIKQLKDAEIVHFYDGKDIIYSKGNKVAAEIDGELFTFTIPIKGWKKICIPFRILRRFLRLDKAIVLFVDKSIVAMVIVYDYRVFYYSRETGLKYTYSLAGARTALHQSICRTDSGNIYFGKYWKNSNRDEVPIYVSCDNGQSWKEAYTFSSKSIRHIHGCYWDPYEHKVWTLTGDFEGECYMLVADESFENCEILGDGSQYWRAVNLFFEQDAVYWVMDSSLETNYLIKLDRKTRKIEVKTPFPGPVWYIKRLQDGYYLIGTVYETCPAVRDNNAYIFLSSDLENWKEVAAFEHDGWPTPYFKWGIIGFADGKQTSDDFYIFGEALKGLDGRALQCGIKQNVF